MGRWEPWFQAIVCDREEKEIHEAAMQEAVSDALAELSDVEPPEQPTNSELTEVDRERI
jgi:hypothetical protein